MKKELIEKLNDTGAFFEEIHHSVLSMESYRYAGFLEDLCDSGKQACISNKLTDDIIDEYYEDGELTKMVLDFSLPGFIARLDLPEILNIRFDENGKYRSSLVNYGTRRIEYVLAPTTDDLCEKAIKLAENHKNEAIENARKNLSSQLS